MILLFNYILNDLSEYSRLQHVVHYNFYRRTIYKHCLSMTAALLMSKAGNTEALVRYRNQFLLLTFAFGNFALYYFSLLRTTFFMSLKTRRFFRSFRDLDLFKCCSKFICFFRRYVRFFLL